jgi:lipopolysaccharide export system protein LptA
VEGAALNTVALFCAYALASATPTPVKAECDGAVEWKTLDDGASCLSMTGGVRVRRGETLMRARIADVVFDQGSDSARTVSASGEVVVESPTFSALADSADMVRMTREGEDGAAIPYYIIRLSRGTRAWIEIRSGDFALVCAGPAAYDDSTRTVLLQGGVRGTNAAMDLRASTARITFVKREDAPAEAGVQDEPADERGPDIERMVLTGSVEILTRPRDGSVARAIRAPHAVYLAENDTLTLTGDPPPEIESSGVIVTAPEMRLDLGTNRIESSTGKMRARIKPSGGE